MTAEEHVYFVVATREGAAMKRYLGVDLHRNCFTVHTRQEDGNGESREWSIRSLKAFTRTVQADDAVAVEATGNVRLFCEALQGCGCAARSAILSYAQAREFVS